MRNTIRYSSILAAFLAAGAFAHSPLAAQQAIILSAPPANAKVAAAMQLEASAAREMYSSRDWRNAAAALEQAADLRGAKDPVAAKDLLSAGQTYFYLNDELVTARILLDEAGRHAERIGAFDLAVQAYVGAFRVAMQLDDVDLANTYLHRLAVLNASPRVSAETKKEFLGPVSAELARDGI